MDFLEEAKKAGKIRNTGFSYYDDEKFFKEILDSYNWDLCQIQYNYLENNSWEKLIDYAKNKGVAVVIMEPLLGGRLANNLPYEIQEVFKEYKVMKKPAELALNWVFSNRHVSVVLSGMSAFEQVRENISIAANFSKQMLKENELKAIQQIRQLFEKKARVGCTGCEYCLPCPSKVNISDIFFIYNNYLMFGNIGEFKANYKELTMECSDAGKCISCGRCEELCPQRLQVINLLKKAHSTLY